MKWLEKAWHELAGLFVDDGFLAAAVVVVVGLAILLAYGFDAPRVLVGVWIVVGAFGALIESVRRGTRPT